MSSEVSVRLATHYGFGLLAATLGGCLYDPPDLPGHSEIPIEAPAADYDTCARERDARVGCVLDGDTVILGNCDDDSAERVRLLGIDAPEIAHEENPAECFGAEATSALADLVLNEEVFLTFDLSCEDVYGRTLAWLRLLSEETDTDEQDDAIFVNEWLLREGYVKRYAADTSDTLIYYARMEAAENAARAEGAGLWTACES